VGASADGCMHEITILHSSAQEAVELDPSNLARRDDPRAMPFNAGYGDDTVSIDN
jgi:hypothetical protein